MNLLSPGALLLYHQDCAVLNQLNGEKLEIRTGNGSSRSVRRKDVVFLHPGPVQQLPPPEPGNADPEGAFELMGEETLSFSDFAELLYGSATAGAFFGAWKILQNGIYFTGSPEEGVRARPRAEADAALQLVREKAEAQEKHAALLERIRRGNVLPEDRPFLNEIELVAYGINPSSRLMHELEIEAVPEKAHALLLKLHVWDETVNPYPKRMGISLADPDLPLPPLPEEERTDLTHLSSYAIDNEGSSDPDDAIGFSDGLLWVHAADPSAVVQPETDLDRTARANGENLYLPEKILHMLPPAATETFGLGLQETSPALSFGIRIDDEGKAHLEKLCLSRIRVERLTYESARPHMTEPDFVSMLEALERFRKYRESNGALFIRLPETDVFLRENGQVEIRPVPITPEREMVANAMLAAGAAVGEWAVSHEIPMPFAAQARGEDLPEERESMSGMYLLRKSCTAGFVTASAEEHAGLGLRAYVRVTSPLRRYTDLLAHQQLRKYLKGEPLFTSDEISERYPEAEKEGALRRKTERFSNEFFRMAYLIQHKEWHGEAVVVQHPDDRTAFLIPELAYEFKMRGFSQIPLNETVDVSLLSVDLPLILPRFAIRRRA